MQLTIGQASSQKPHKKTLSITVFTLANGKERYGFGAILAFKQSDSSNHIASADMTLSSRIKPK
jgi:hypothetical protein